MERPYPIPRKTTAESLTFEATSVMSHDMSALGCDVKQPKAGEVTQLLEAWSAGDPQADDRLFAIIYDELSKISAYYRRREAPHHTLQTTDLVHEAYLRLAGQQRVSWKNRGHFLAVAAQAMRRVLVDHARRRNAAKRGKGADASPFDSIALAMESSADLVDIDTALDRLARLDAREARVVELRFFAGLTMPEVARALGVSVATVEREWAAARAWLRRELM